jgi:hypothetical protein
VRFSAGASRNPGAKAHFKIKHFSAGLKSISPLLKQGAPTKSLPTDVFRSCESRIQHRHAENHPLDCIVSRLWLVYKSVERRELGKRRATLLGMPATRKGRSGDASAIEFSQPRSRLNAVAVMLQGVECEVRAVKRRYGQLAVTVRKPSPCGSIAQWCLPLRRQQAGTPDSRASSMGRASPASSRTSSKLAARRRMSSKILLHHSGL